MIRTEAPHMSHECVGVSPEARHPKNFSSVKRELNEYFPQEQPTVGDDWLLEHLLQILRLKDEAFA
jgi:hypothetical protein